MAVVTSYVCDRCKHEQQSNAKPREMFVIGIGIHWVQHRPEKLNLAHQQLWCDNCCKEVGIRAEVQFRELNAPEPSRPTFESMLREIIREEISNA